MTSVARSNMPMDLARILPGLVSPVADSQRAFRATLQAMSYPGRIVTPVAHQLPWPEQIPGAAVAILLALCDADTRLWCGQRWRADNRMIDSLRFHTGTTIVEAAAEADFALHDGDQDAPLTAFSAGDDLDPQFGATLILVVDALDRGRPIRLSGPGLASPSQIRVSGPSDAFWRSRIALEPLFPRGIDLLLVQANAVMAIPRTTHLELA
ncbi:MAG: phosphonate C-P lyase system protein PhnH [Burkholderiaceae bacterium]